VESRRICAVARGGIDRLGLARSVRTSPVWRQCGASATWAIQLVYGFVITMAGVFLGSAFRELKRQKEELRRQSIHPLSFFAGVLRSIDFWMGVCAAPIVYALLIRSLDGGGDAGLTVIALQNGFCCTLLASQVLNNDRESAARTP